MYQLYSDRLPAVFAQLFKKIKEIHSHNTRQTENQLIFFHVYLKQLAAAPYFPWSQTLVFD